MTVPVDLNFLLCMRVLSNIYDQCKLANDDVSVGAEDAGAGVKTFREWEELLGGDPEQFDQDPLVTAGGGAPTET